MVQITAQGILLDIEGTTSSLHFVHEVMFPFARQHLRDYLQQNWGSDAIERCLKLLAIDLEMNSRNDWLNDHSESEQQTLVEQAVLQLMDRDAKVTGLKELQGLIWRAGFESGQLVSHLYDDVSDCIRDWAAAGMDLRIFSSGSIAAQKLFFRYSSQGDLTGYFRTHYDTTIGSKQSDLSYQKIADDFGLTPGQIVFVSDVLAELKAAQKAGMQSILSIRPGNQPVEEPHEFPSINSFRQLCVI
jgi:enolase-phosphatase E1